jgi:uncharacterized membrane protein YfhO
MRRKSDGRRVVVFIGYVVVAVLAAAMNVWAASMDFRRAEMAVTNASKVEVPSSWVIPLGALKFAGALGLIAGIVVPLIGVAAAAVLILFFVCAIFAHLRVSWYATLPFPIAFLLLALCALALRLTSAGSLWAIAPRLSGA